MNDRINPQNESSTPSVSSSKMSPAAAAAASLLLFFAAAISAVLATEKIVCAPQLFSFADSLSDTGNLCTTSPNLCIAGRLPYGQNFPAGPTGRFSNGLNILDCVAKGFGLPLLDPIFQIAGANYTHGINFANAGCTASFLESLVVPARGRNPFDFAAQVNEFRRLQRIVQKRYKASGVDFRSLPDLNAFGSALYYIELGGNDLNYNNLIGKSEEYLDTEVIPQVMTSISNGIQKLVKFGAKNFLIFGLPAQGCASINLAQGKTATPTPTADDYDELGCLKFYNRITINYNNNLTALISDLRDQYPNNAFIYADYYAVHVAMLNGTLGSFKNRTNLINACCGMPGVEYNCPSPPSPVFGCYCTTENVCPDPDDFIIWDGIHFTEAFSKVAAAAFLQRDSPYLDTGAGVRLDSRCGRH